MTATWRLLMRGAKKPPPTITNYASWGFTSSTSSQSFNVPVGSNLLVVFVYSAYDNVTSLTYNGVSLTQQEAYAPNSSMQMYVLENPATGTHTLSVTNDGSTANVWAAVAIENYSSFVSAKSTGTSITHQVSVATDPVGGLVLGACVTRYPNYVLTTAAGFSTIVYVLNSDLPIQKRLSVIYKVPTLTTTTCEWTSTTSLDTQRMALSID